MSDISFWTNTWNKLKYGWDLNWIGDTLIICPDFSHWSVNFPPENYFDEDKFAKKIEEHGTRAIIYKGTDSDKVTGRPFTDRTAKFWWGIGGKFNLLRGCYHWLQYSIDPTVAFNYHQILMDECPTELPYVLDFEEPSVTSFSDYLWRAKVWLELARDASGKKPVVYTGMGYLGNIRAGLGSSQVENKMGFLRQYDLWLAFYSRYWPSKAMQLNKNLSSYPWGPEEWKMLQYTFNGDYPYYIDGDALWGDEWGITSLGLDLNYFKKEWLDLYDTGVEPPPVEPPVEPPVPVEPSDELQFKTLYKMNVRSGPGTQFPVVLTLPINEIITVNNVGGSNSWIQMDGGWVCHSLNNNTYLEVQ